MYRLHHVLPMLSCLLCKLTEGEGQANASGKKQRLSVLDKSLDSLKRIFHRKFWLGTLHSFMYSSSPKIAAPGYTCECLILA